MIEMTEKRDTMEIQITVLSGLLSSALNVRTSLSSKALLGNKSSNCLVNQYYHHIT